jgi:FixJ family two-component response regulator
MVHNVARIAVVEDDADVRTALQQLLTAAAFEALAFASAEEFLASARRESVDCLIADIHLPGMNGIALLQTLAADGDAVPAVLITARDDAATLESMRQAGSTPHLRKPFSVDALFNAIDRALGEGV